MIWTKDGVCGDLQIPAQKARGEVALLYEARGHDFYITALRDGNHGYNSLHYIGLAFDFRKVHEVSKRDIVSRLIEKFGSRKYDVVEHATHMHIEYDPKD